MTEEKPLSEFIQLGRLVSYIPTAKVKHKVKRAEERLKEKIKISEDIFLRDTTQSPFLITKRIKFQLEQVFKEEFGFQEDLK